MTESAKSLLVNALLEAEGAELESVECTAVPSSSFSRRIKRIAAHPEKYSKRRVKKRFRYYSMTSFDLFADVIITSISVYVNLFKNITGIF